jgi:dTDP-4-dehydrorhamnose 3,5-epimerase
MRFLLTTLPGVLRIDAEPHRDARGLFARLYCPEEFAAAGIGDCWGWQVSLSRNPIRHTLRGMHFQAAPDLKVKLQRTARGEAKLVRAVRGRAYDVVIDLRRDSPRYGDWIALELDAEAMNAVFVPEGCAHGFMTLQPDTDVLYQISPVHVPGHGCGVRWNDPAFGVRWPAEPVLLDARDANWPDWIAPRTAWCNSVDI